MQSGKARTGKWILEFEPLEAEKLDPLMGWAGSGDTRAQVKLSFATADEAKAYGERVGLDVEVIETRQTKKMLRSYADRFAFDRIR